MQRLSVSVGAGVLLMLSAGSGWAANLWVPDRNDCANGDTTMSIVDCHEKRTAVWDARLNQAWKALTAHLASEPQRLTALRTAEQAWIKFRDANCAFQYSQSGTIRQIATANCMHDMTQSRAIELQAELPQ